MNAFSQKYPAFAALLNLLAVAAKDLVAPGSLVGKLSSLVNEIAPIVAFMPQAGLLGAEVAALKASPQDIIMCGEALVADLAFSSGKAQAIIAAAFPVGEALAGLVPQIEALVAAIKA